jgi:predicted small secreted protein
MSKRLAAVSFALAAVLALTACANTIRGAGRDVGNTVSGTKGAVRDVTSR